MLMIYLSLLESDDDRHYFLFLHKTYEMKMYQVAIRILKSRALAEEAIQDSWVSVIKSFQKIKTLPGDKTEGYIVTIVKNTSLNILKKEKHADPFPEEWEAPSVEDQPERGFHRLVHLIRTMPEQYRRVLELKLVMEWANQDIARCLNLNESTVASRIARGRSLLITKLREEEYSYE